MCTYRQANNDGRKGVLLVLVGHVLASRGKLLDATLATHPATGHIAGVLFGEDGRPTVLDELVGTPVALPDARGWRGHRAGGGGLSACTGALVATR